MKTLKTDDVTFVDENGLLFDTYSDLAFTQVADIFPVLPSRVKTGQKWVVMGPGCGPLFGPSSPDEQNW